MSHSGRSRSVGMRGRRSALAWAVVSGGWAAGAGAQVTTNWNVLVDGDWSNGANWDNGAPINNGFDAVIALAGTYRVTLDGGFDINDFELTSSGATLDLNANRLGIEGALTLTNALIDSSLLGGEMEVFGAATLTDTHILGSRMTFNDDMVFDSSTGDELCDTDIDHRGALGRWMGTGNILLDEGSSFLVSSASTFQIENDASLVWEGNGARATFQNDGVVTKQIGAGETFIDGIDFTNAGALRVESGTLRINRTTNLSGGVLAGGDWEVLNGTTLNFDGLGVLTNQTNVMLSGAGASFLGFENVEVNDTGALVSVLAGATFTAGGVSFENRGTLDVDAGSQFTIDSGTPWVNLAGNTLSGGEYILRGVLASDNADIQEIDAVVTLDGLASDIFDPAGGVSALEDLARVGSAGSLSLTNDRDFTTTGEFEVATTGVLAVGPDSTFRVAETFDLVNFVGGTLTGGVFDIQGQIIADNAAVDDLSSDVTLDGPGDRFVNGQTGDGAFDTMTRINADGRLVLRNGHELVLSDDLVVEGELVIEDSDGARPGRQRTSLHVQGSLEHTLGTLNLAGGLITVDQTLHVGPEATLAGFGEVHAAVDVAGGISPGDGAGRLEIVGDLTVDDSLGFIVDVLLMTDDSGNVIIANDLLRIVGEMSIDAGGDGRGGTVHVRLPGNVSPTEGMVFTVLRATEGVVGSLEFFTGLEIGPDLYFDPRQGARGLRLVVVPAPGGVALGVGLLLPAACSRRRHF